jgi:Ca2+-binding RTX toxin-like protein
MSGAVLVSGSVMKIMAQGRCAAIGDVIGTLSASDPQPSDSFTFSLQSDPSGRFAIAGTSLVLAAALDFEAAHSHEIVVRVTDAAGNSFDKTLTIEVSNVGGVTIRGTEGNDLIDVTQTPPGQSLPTDEEDVINGRSGQDTMAAGGGNDRYCVDNAGDVVTEAADQGTDTVFADVDYALQAGSHVEVLRARIDAGWR